jgi:hypothetical protein
MRPERAIMAKYTAGVCQFRAHESEYQILHAETVVKRIISCYNLLLLSIYGK